MVEPSRSSCDIPRTASAQTICSACRQGPEVPAIMVDHALVLLWRCGRVPPVPDFLKQSYSKYLNSLNAIWPQQTQQIVLFSKRSTLHANQVICASMVNNHSAAAAHFI